MVRVTLKQVQKKLDKINRIKGTDFRIFPNYLGYAISNYHNGIYQWPNAFNGSLKECLAFLKGMMYGHDRKVCGDCVCYFSLESGTSCPMKQYGDNPLETACFKYKSRYEQTKEE